MPAHKPCIGILTSGGDCPGLNAVIRAAVKSSERLGYDCIGFLRGYEGLVEPVSYMPLTSRNTAGILTQGGTILGSTNKGRFSATIGEDQRVAIDPALLDQVATTLGEFNQTVIEVAGHTDSTGARAYNMTLSERRAGSVLSYLSGRGIARERMIAVGAGPDHPVDTNDTSEGRAQNRRVEITLVPVEKKTG